jgi:hypothetical protein
MQKRLFNGTPTGCQASSTANEGINGKRFFSGCSSLLNIFVQFKPYHFSQFWAITIPPKICEYG